MPTDSRPEEGGSTGAQGATGPQGPTGADGPQGLQGPQGPQVLLVPLAQVYFLRPILLDNGVPINSLTAVRPLRVLE